MSELPVVRAAGIDDVEQLSSTGSGAFRDAYGASAPESDIAQHVDAHFGVDAIYAEVQRSDVEYFMATDDGECAGFVKLRASPPPSDIRAETALEVQQLYVASSYQRKGVGRLLMNRVVQHARERAVDGIWLTVWSEAEWATGFYRRYGFSERGKVPFYLGSTKHVDYVMWLPTVR